MIIVYDITDINSFTQIDEHWLGEVEKNAPSNAVLMVVGNKSDLEESRAVTVQRAKEFAKSKEAMFMEASAKDATNVSKAFMMLAESIKERIK